jgi:hypothetical protein
MTGFDLKNCALVAATLLACGCIERDNPYDPRNFQPPSSLSEQDRQQLRDSLQAPVDSALIGLQHFRWSLDALVEFDSAANARIGARNDSVRAANDALRDSNSAVATHNDTAQSAARLRYHRFLDTLDYFLPAVVKTDIDTAAVRIARLEALTHIDSVNRAYAPDTIYPSRYRDSVAGSFDSALGAARVELAHAAEVNATVRDSNAAVQAYNSQTRAYNDSAAAFNEQVDLRRRYPDRTPVSDQDSLVAATAGAAPGEVILVAGGVYDPHLRFTAGAPGDTIVIAGEPDMSTIFENSDILLDGENGYITFRNIVFRKGTTFPGVKLTDGAGPVVFHRCRFLENRETGLDIVDSDALLIDCRIAHNGSHGVRITGDPAHGATVRIVNTLITHNRVAGVYLTNVNLSLRRVTIADNAIDGIRITSQELSFFAENSLLTYNGGYAVHVGNDYVPQGASPFNNVYIFGNVQGVFGGPFGDPVYVATNPEYRDRTDYVPREGSVLWRLEQDSTVIGYRP